MKALVLESTKKLSLRDFPITETVGPYDVKIRIKACGICGSDVHYYMEGAIGDFIVKEPMILGHEAAGIIIEKGEKVKNLNIGDLVCMEPGIPDMQAPEVLEGNYHLDPDIRFWATPPIHGCLRETVVHPARFCFKLPKGMSAAEGAMMEPLATGVEAAKKARIEPGDTALVVGCGTIGIMVAIAALAGGCSKVFISDVKQEKLDIAGSYANIVPINVPWIQVHGLSIETLFRYTNQFGKAVALVSAGKIDVKRLISKTFTFDKSVEAYEYAAAGHPDVVKVMIELP